MRIFRGIHALWLALIDWIIREPVRRYVQTNPPKSPLSVEQKVSSDSDEASGDIAELEKKLSMTMGALQAATSQLMELKSVVKEASREASKALQVAQSAQRTAEDTANGLTELEDSLSQRDQ